MNKQKLIPILGGLLALQLLLALMLTLGNTDPAATETTALIEADTAAIDRIRIEDSTDSVTLQKTDAQWQVVEANFPADEERVTKLLETLSGLQQGWPVATTGDAAKRFKVDSKTFERKLTLSRQNETVAELFVGTAPTYRKTHLRRGDRNEIHLAEFNAYESAARPQEWTEKGILRQEPANITAVKLPGLTLQRNADGLSIDNLKNDQQTNAEEAESLLRKIADIRINAVLGLENKPEYRQNKPSHTIVLSLNDGTSVTYTISKPADESHYILKSSSRPEYFQVPTYTLNPIFETSREQLVEARQAAEETKTS